MPRTREQLEQAAADAERWLDQLDPDDPTVYVDKVGDLREIGDALTRVSAAEQRVAAAVHAARANGRSWTDIARVLGVSRQAAQKRYDRPAGADGGAGSSDTAAPDAAAGPPGPARRRSTSTTGVTRTRWDMAGANRDVVAGRFSSKAVRRGGLTARSGVNGTIARPGSLPRRRRAN